MRKLIGLLAIIVALLAFSGCAADPAAGAGEGVPVLRMMFWGGLDELNAMTDVINRFNAQNEGRVYVIPLHTPADYVMVMNAMIADGEPPDIAYIAAGNFQVYASEGHLLDMSTLPGFNVGDFLPRSVWRYQGRVYALSTAEVNLFLAYNPELFEEHGITPPPHRIENALSRDDFLNLAQRMTFDRQGRNALDPNFDGNNVAVFGFNHGPWLNNTLLMVTSAGGSLLNADRTNTNFDTDPWIDTLYFLNRTIYTYRVSPTPFDTEGFPYQAFLSGAFAMQIDGRWSMLWLNNIGLNVGVSVLPDFGHGPYTMSAPGVTAIFAASEHPELAWEFYQFKIDVQNGATELYTQGLWQPILEKWYHEPYLAVWTDNYRHPESFFGGIIDMSLRPERNVQLPAQYIRQLGELTTFVNPVLQEIWGRQMTRAEIASIMQELQRNVEANNAFRGVFN